MPTAPSTTPRTAAGTGSSSPSRRLSSRGAQPVRARRRGHRPGPARPQLPLAPRLVRHHERRRRRRAGRRAAAGGVADPRPAAGLPRGPVPEPARPALRVPRGSRGGPRRPAADRGPGQPGPVAGAGGPCSDDRGGRHQHRADPRRAVRPGHRGDVRRRRLREPPASPRAPRGPGHRQRAAVGRPRADQQARGAADRGVPVRGRDGAAVRHGRRLLRARGAPRHANHLSRGRHRPRGLGVGHRARRAGGPARGHRRGPPLARPQPADADARPDDHRVQRDVRRRLVSPRPLRGRAARHERGGIRIDHVGDGGRRDHRHGLLRPAGAPVRARRHHAGRPPRSRRSRTSSWR